MSADPRSRARRRRDTEHRLTPADSPTGRNLAATRAARVGLGPTRAVRLGLGPTRDVSMIEGEVEILEIDAVPLAHHKETR